MIKIKLFALTLLAVGSMILTIPVSAHENTGTHTKLWWADRNHDGIIGPGERRHARYIRNRIDVNDDGRIGHRERLYARNVYRSADSIGDGRIGPRERAAVYRYLNRVDRNH